MRLDHIAYRVRNRDKAVKFFMDAFGYQFQAEFEIFFNDEKTDKALCVALEPPEKKTKYFPSLWEGWEMPGGGILLDQTKTTKYHMAPEIFVSEGTPGSIVWNWVQARQGTGGVHHCAYEVESVADKMKEWTSKGYAEFSSDKPFKCDDLTQVFTKPSDLTGVVYEFIERKAFGFCAGNVKKLMESTANLDKRIP